MLQAPADPAVPPFWHFGGTKGRCGPYQMCLSTAGAAADMAAAAEPAAAAAASKAAVGMAAAAAAAKQTRQCLAPRAIRCCGWT